MTIIENDLATGGIPPGFPILEEAMRCLHTRLRRRMLEGTWRDDLLKAICSRVGIVRTEAWAESPVLETNPFAAICKELAVLYVEPPLTRHDLADPTEVSNMEVALDAAGLWGLLARMQRYCLGLREMFIRIDLENGYPTFRPVYPDMVWALPRQDKPDQPIEVRELRQRDVLGKRAWTYDILSIRDPANPTYAIHLCQENGNVGADISDQFWDAPRSGDAYPYRRRDGTPFLPIVLYHAERTGDRLFDAYTWAEIVDGSLSLAVKANLLDHTFVQASWPQRWMLGTEVAGMETDGKRREIVTDPAVVTQLRKQEDFDGQPQVGQWEAGGDIEKMQNVLEGMSAQLASEAGVSVSDIQRLNSQRSGVSISLTNEGKRSQQRRFAIHFRESDQRLVAIVAALFNRYNEGIGLPANYPEGGWQILYRELPLSPDELNARRNNILELLSSKMISRIQAFRELNPGLSEKAARIELEKIDAGTVASSGGKIVLTSTDIAGIVTVNEARASQDLPPLEGEDGMLTVSRYQAKYASVIAIAASAAAGNLPQ